MTDTLSFGRWLKRRRLELALTQAGLANQAGYSVVTIRKLESDDLRPSRELAERLAVHLDIPTDDRAAFVQFARGEAADSAFGQRRPLPSPADHPDPLARPALPTPPTELVGRAEEVDELRGLLLVRPDVRLVTLTGAGGSGKTRLALEMAGDLAPAFGDGAAFVDLAPLADAALVPVAIAETLGVRETGDRPLLASLAEALRRRHLLLVLDNFEHVLAAGPAVAGLLAAAPRLRVLATSRAPLRVRGEHVYPVAPLDYPAPASLASPTTLSVEAIAAYPAVALFERRAQAADPEFRLTADNAAAVADICRRLDGLPLALELAAARVRLLPPSDMRQRLAAPLAFLSSGPRDLPARQQTLRAILTWSYDLLDASEQALFRRLGVFAGGFSLEAVAAIGSDVGVDVLDAIETLLGQGLLARRGGPHGEARFTLLETVREYALEKLAEHAETGAAQAGHAQYITSYVESAVEMLLGPEQLVWLDRLDAEHDNIRAALRWAVDHDATDTGQRLVGALRWFWTHRSHLREGYDWARAVLAQADSAVVTPARARALWCAGVMAWLVGDETSVDHLTAARDTARQAGDARTEGFALQHLSLRLVYAGRVDEARASGEASVAVFRAIGDTSGLPYAVNTLSVAVGAAGDEAGRAALVEEAVSLYRASGDRFGLALALRELAEIASLAGREAEATAYLEECVTLLLQMGTRHELATAWRDMAGLARRAGDLDRAARLLTQTADLYQEVGDAQAAQDVRRDLAALAADQAPSSRAAPPDA